MWMSELAMKTSTAESTVGKRIADHAIMKTSGEVDGPQKLAV
jgi:hypothetical protein